MIISLVPFAFSQASDGLYPVESKYFENETEVRRITNKMYLQEDKNILTQVEDDKKYGMNSFYLFQMSSIGSFQEEVNSFSLNSSQNSPLSLGLGGTFYRKSHWSLSGSHYISYFTAGETSTNQQISIPFEQGTTLQVGKNWSGFGAYLGFDYEQFNSFNTEELSLINEVKVRKNKIGFGSVAISKVLEIGKREIYFKVSFAQSLLSSSSKNGTEFKGSKIMFYANYKLNKRLFVHTLYKRHTLKGKTDLSINRYGVGFGVNFF